MVLKDFYCPECNHCMEEFADGGQTRFAATCPNCGEQVIFESRCNGGLGKRYRFCDWPDDPEFFRGQVKASSCEMYQENEDGTERPVEHMHGGVIHEREKYKDGSDRRETKRDELKHDTRRKRGTLPMVFDQKGVQ